MDMTTVPHNNAAAHTLCSLLQHAVRRNHPFSPGSCSACEEILKTVGVEVDEVKELSYP